jgi:hypothetical protein
MYKLLMNTLQKIILKIHEAFSLQIGDISSKLQYCMSELRYLKRQPQMKINLS